ncbi:MAG TPA: type II secretion system F family protein, partial [Vitreimonas sp.]|nr:type II secretion system F family protein [Vitreimonas sp.]
MLARLNAVLGRPAAQPLDGVRVLSWIGSKIPGGSDARLHSELLRAGYFHASALHAFVALRLLLAFAAFCAVLLHAAAWTAQTFLLATFAAFFVSRLTVILLKLSADRRERRIRRELPPLVDVLMMVLNSGISIDQSLRYVTGMIGQTSPATSAVLKRYVADIDSGMPFETAFERMGQRFAINEGYDLANLIKQSLLQGGEILAS